MNTYSRKVSPSAAVLTVALLVLLVVLFWKWILLGLAGVLAWRKMAHRAYGTGRRRRGSLAATITAVSAAFVAWNSRWIRPRSQEPRVTVPPSADCAAKPYDQDADAFGEVPF